MYALPRPLLTCLLVMSAASPAAAKKIVVSPGPGTPVADAAAQLEDGDKLIFQPGVYTERLVLDGLSRIKVLAKGKGDVVFATSAASSVQIQDCNKVKIKGITVRGGMPATGIGVLRSESVSLIRCVVEDVQFEGISVGAPSTVKVSRCTISDAATAILATGDTVISVSRCTVDGEGTFVGAQLSLLTVPGSSVVRSTFRETRSAAIEIGGPGTSVQRNTIERCLFGLVVALNKDASGSVVAKNRFSDVEAVAVRLLSGGATVTRNRIERVGSSAVQCGSGSEPAVVTKNRISDAPNGIDVESAGAVIDKNRVSATENYAIRLRGGPVASCAKNRLSDNAGNAFDIWTGGHTLTRNRASGSGGADITARVDLSELTLVKNRFASQN